ncbi:MAG: uroporphyrinogen-III synthase [Gammaproteobacteria bacterium]
MNIIVRPRCVLVTRPTHQSVQLSELIEQRGWRVVRFPTLEILPAFHSNKVARLLRRLHDFDTLIFISANAVNFALQANGGKIDPFNNHRIAAVGRATARALEAAGLRVALLPSTGFNSEALLDLPEFRVVKGQSFLIVRGEGGRETLADTLRDRGAIVEYLEVYKRIRPKSDNGQVAQLLKSRELDVITITSGEALQNFMAMLDRESQHMALAVPLIVISERMKEIAEELGFKTILIADSPADAAIFEKVTTVCNGE